MPTSSGASEHEGALISGATTTCPSCIDGVSAVSWTLSLLQSLLTHSFQLSVGSHGRTPPIHSSCALQLSIDSFKARRMAPSVKHGEYHRPRGCKLCFSKAHGSLILYGNSTNAKPEQEL